MILDWEDAFHTSTAADREGVRRQVCGVPDGPVRERRLPRSVGAGRCLHRLVRSGFVQCCRNTHTGLCGPILGHGDLVSVVGPATSWKKLQRGRQAKWIGVLVQLEEKAVVITLPD